MLDISAHERAYAAAAGKKLWLGVETTPLPDEVTYSFGGVPRQGQPGDNEILLVAEPGGGRFVFGPADESGLVWPITGRDPAPGNALSFAGLPPSELDRLQGELGAIPLAFHDLNGWMKLRERP